MNAAADFRPRLVIRPSARGRAGGLVGLVATALLLTSCGTTTGPQAGTSPPSVGTSTPGAGAAAATGPDLPADFAYRLPGVSERVSLAVVAGGDVGGSSLTIGDTRPQPALRSMTLPLALAARVPEQGDLAATARTAIATESAEAVSVLWQRAAATSGGASPAAAVQNVVNEGALTRTTVDATSAAGLPATPWGAEAAARLLASTACRPDAVVARQGLAQATSPGERWALDTQRRQRSASPSATSPGEEASSPTTGAAGATAGAATPAAVVGTPADGEVEQAVQDSIATLGQETIVRRSALVRGGRGVAGVVLVVRATSPDAARQDVDRIEGWLADHVADLPMGRCAGGVDLPLYPAEPPAGASDPGVASPAAPLPPNATITRGPSQARPGTAPPGAGTAACPTPPAEPVRHAPGAGRTVALTFDDGPGGVTPEVRAILRRYGVRATFFHVGQRIAGDRGEEQALIADGHLVANHTWDHLYPRDVPWTPAHLDDQMRRTSELIAADGGRPVCFFRPPGGVMHNVMGAATRRGLTVVLWSRDTADWTQPPTTTRAATAAIVERATRSPGEHPIVLMHTAKASNEPEAEVHSHRGNTVAALPRIIEWYRDHGYRFVDLTGGSGLRG